ncbi:MAG: hypothetical protein IPJ09_09205 [Saprospiraceae bacterium]|nr:hypothetical protein [Saprospiraceae bacterium]
MKGIILGIIAFSISTQCISQQSFVEYFELKNMLPNSLKIADLTNLDPQTNIPRNAQKQTGVLFAPQKIKLDHVEPFLSFSAAWSEQNEDQKSICSLSQIFGQWPRLGSVAAFTYREPLRRWSIYCGIYLNDPGQIHILLSTEVHQ